jgi:hypothetical protein
MALLVRNFTGAVQKDQQLQRFHKRVFASYPGVFHISFVLTASYLEPDRAARRVFPACGGDDHDGDEPMRNRQSFRSKLCPGRDEDSGNRPGQYVQNAILCDLYGAFRDFYGQSWFPDLLHSIPGVYPEVCGEAKLENHYVDRMRLDHAELPDICLSLRSPLA